MRARAAGAEAAVRRAGLGPEAAASRGGSADGRRKRAASSICSASSPPRDVWYEDMRILVSHGEVIGAMRRRSRRWITNVRQGAKPMPCEPTRARARAGSARLRRARRGFRRRRHHQRRRRPADGARGQQHGGLERAAERHALLRSPSASPATYWRRSRRRAPRAWLTPRSEQIARAFIAACEDELAAPKPGNVHIYAAGHGMEAQDFIDSADAAAPHLCAQGASVGRRIFDAVEATWARVGCNTNLGIILLCAPLAHAAQREQDAASLREKLAATLDALDRDDADLAFRAIARASPAGLGSAPQHDVAAPATIGLREAMALAADRDRVAHAICQRLCRHFRASAGDDRALERARRRRRDDDAAISS